MSLRAMKEQKVGDQARPVGSDNRYGSVRTKNTPKSHQLSLAFFVAGCCC